MLLGEVCRLWRDVAENEPLLWTRLSGSCGQLQKYIQRAQTQPLVLVYQSPDPVYYEDHMDTFLAIVRPFAHQIVSLDVTALDTTPFSALDSAPITHLRISGFPGFLLRPRPPPLKPFGQLATLTLSYSKLPPATHLPPTVTDFSMLRMKIQVSIFRNLIRFSRQLRTLRVTEVLADGPVGASTMAYINATSFTLPVLEKLSIVLCDHVVSHVILAGLSTPSTTLVFLHGQVTPDAIPFISAFRTIPRSPLPSAMHVARGHPDIFIGIRRRMLSLKYAVLPLASPPGLFHMQLFSLDDDNMQILSLEDLLAASFGSELLWQSSPAIRLHVEIYNAHPAAIATLLSHLPEEVATIAVDASSASFPSFRSVIRYLTGLHSDRFQNVSALKIFGVASPAQAASIIGMVSSAIDTLIVCRTGACSIEPSFVDLHLTAPPTAKEAEALADACELACIEEIKWVVAS